LIHFTSHSKIDKQKWDALIAASPQQNIYAYSWYLDIACPGWQAFIWDDYEAVMPLPVNRKWGISYVYRPYFVQQLGVYSKPGLENTVMHFAKKLLTHFRFVEYAFNHANQPFIAKHEKILWQAQDNYVLHQTPAYNQNLRRNLKQAFKHNLVVETVDEKVIVDLFKNNKGKTIESLKAKHYQNLLKICRSVKAHASVYSAGVKVQQSYCAGMIIFNLNNQHVFVFSATDNIAKQYKVMPFLIDNYLQQFQPQIFDFEGSNHSNLARFYKSFGAQLQPYSMLKINTLPAPVKWLKK
jgi:hypothetical protein